MLWFCKVETAAKRFCGQQYGNGDCQRDEGLAEQA